MPNTITEIPPQPPTDTSHPVLTSPTWQVPSTRFRSGLAGRHAEEVVVEEPLEIRINGRPIAVTMRTPGHDFELVAGFLWTEQIVSHPDDILAMVHCGQLRDPELQNVVDVRLAPDVHIDVESVVRHFFAASGCGVCGKTTVSSLMRTASELPWGLVVTPGVVSELPVHLLTAQPIFSRTGGLHAAGLFTSHGLAAVVREDIGRHNAVDKVIGYSGLRGIGSLADRILCVSGRAGFEIVQKAWIAQIPIVVAVSAPSSLAIQTAMAAKITLIGFSREDRFTIYTHPERIVTG